jgi:hypothetical protein
LNTVLSPLVSDFLSDILIGLVHAPNSQYPKQPPNQSAYSERNYHRHTHIHTLSLFSSTLTTRSTALTANDVLYINLSTPPHIQRLHKSKSQRNHDHHSYSAIHRCGHV